MLRALFLPLIALSFASAAPAFAVEVAPTGSCTNLFLSPNEARLLDAYEKTLRSYESKMSSEDFANETARVLSTGDFYSLKSYSTDQHGLVEFLEKIRKSPGERSELFNLEVRAKFERLAAVAKASADAIAGAVEATKDHNYPITELLDSSPTKGLLFPNGDHTLIVGADASRKELVLWNLETKERKVLLAHSEEIRTMRVTADFKTVITSGWGGLKVWDLEGNRLVFEKETGPEYYHWIEPSADGQRAFLMNHRGAVMLLDLKTGREIFKATSDPAIGAVKAMATTPDFKHAVSSHVSGFVSFDLETGEILRSEKTSQKPNELLSVLPDFSRVVAGSSTGRLISWNPRTGRFRWGWRTLLPWSPSRWGSIRELYPLPSLGRVVTVGANEDVVLWNLRTGTAKKQLFSSWYVTNLKEVHAVSSDEKTLLTCGRTSGSAGFTDLASGQQTYSFTLPFVSEIEAVRVDREFKHALTADKEGNLVLWKISNGEVIRKIPSPDAGAVGSAIVALETDPELTQAVVRTFAGKTRIYDLKSFEESY